MDVLPPYEYHASTSELVQMLEKGHYGVELDDEANRLIVNWIDFNAPWRGKWGNEPESTRRLELSALYADAAAVDIENEYDRLLGEMRAMPDPEFVEPNATVEREDDLDDSWTFDEAEPLNSRSRRSTATQRRKRSNSRPALTLNSSAFPLASS